MTKYKLKPLQWDGNYVRTCVGEFTLYRDYNDTCVENAETAVTEFVGASRKDAEDWVEAQHRAGIKAFLAKWTTRHEECRVTNPSHTMGSVGFGVNATRTPLILS